MYIFSVQTPATTHRRRHTWPDDSPQALCSTSCLISPNSRHSGILSFTTGQFKPRSSSPCPVLWTVSLSLSLSLSLLVAACTILLWNKKLAGISKSVILQRRLCHQILYKLDKQTQYFRNSTCRRQEHTSDPPSLPFWICTYHTQFCQLHLHAFVGFSESNYMVQWTWQIPSPIA